MPLNAQINLFQSGFQDQASLPYVTLAKISNTLDTRDTCGNRVERNIFQISAFDNNFTNSRRILDELERTLDGSILNIGNRRYMSMLWTGRIHREPTRGLYQGILTYEIFAQKDFDATKYYVSSTSGANFWEALFNRYKTTSNKLIDLTNGFVTTKFHTGGWYFLHVPSYEIAEDFATTCNTRGERVSFEIATYGPNPDDVEAILEEVDNVFSYARLVITDKQFTTLEWLGDSLVEIEPEIWRGAIEFNLILEKAL
jgi:hypothetical protein